MNDLANCDTVSLTYSFQWVPILWDGTLVIRRKPVPDYEPCPDGTKEGVEFDMTAEEDCGGMANQGRVVLNFRVQRIARLVG